MTSGAPHRRWSVVKLVLIFLNLLGTWATLFTGPILDSSLLAAAAGRYNVIRQRFRTGQVNYDLVEAEHFKVEDLPTPKQLAEYTFIQAPRRNVKTMGASRNLCLNMNTLAAPVLFAVYNDFWGKMAKRRIQIYVNSISARNCELFNAKPAWAKSCVTKNQNNATLCHQYVLDNFDTLKKDRLIRQGAVKDIGVPGVPFLRCLGRPLEPFGFQADLFTHQTFWDGGAFHLAMLVSDCRGVPLVKSANQQYALFQIAAVDDACDFFLLIPSGGWFEFLVRWTYSFVTLELILLGIKATLFHTKAVRYLPHALRFAKDARWMRFVLPFMEMVNAYTDNERAIITFKGSVLVASDTWTTHWLYMWLSILDAAINIRATYVLLQTAESMLIQKTHIASLIFMCGALTKIAWLLCLTMTLLRVLLKLIVRCIRSFRLIKSLTREKLEWNIDSISILLSYRLLYFVLLIITFTLVAVNGHPSFMVRAVPHKVGAYGGLTRINGFWGSELACDLVTLLGIVTIASQVVGVLLLFTRYKRVADNNVMRLLQQRYIVCGWDGLLAADLLGLDPWDPDFLIDGRGYAKLSVGSLLQLLYLSGPSGFVHFAGDYIFHDSGFSKEPIKFSYPVAKAAAMGLFETKTGSVVSTVGNPTTAGTAGTDKRDRLNSNNDVTASGTASKRSVFDRKLRLVSDGYFGKIIFIDSEVPGQLTTNKETGQREFEVVDALTTMSILDIKHLMGNEKKLRVL